MFASKCRGGCDPSDFDHGVVVNALTAGLNILETANLDFSCVTTSKLTGNETENDQQKITRADLNARRKRRKAS